MINFAFIIYVILGISTTLAGFILWNRFFATSGFHPQ